MELFHAKHKTEFCMKMKTLVAALALSVVGLAMAQTSTPNLDKREAHQQQRINQGVASGQLNAREANRLQQRESKLAADEIAIAGPSTSRSTTVKQPHPQRASKATGSTIRYASCCNWYRRW
jgi:hypothetical protein